MGAAMAYDAADGYVVLFGGLIGQFKIGNAVYDQCASDTWTYKDGDWLNLSIAGPPPSCAPAMAYDSSAGVVVEYGGVDEYDPSCQCEQVWNQTWTFSRGAWSELQIPKPGDQ